ncbi:MAG: hypothetical protein LBJ18_04695 [Rickettsiales bacterium]|nr:hypothetical protein [Rickettsiales bacterium]
MKKIITALFFAFALFTNAMGVNKKDDLNQITYTCLHNNNKTGLYIFDHDLNRYMCQGNRTMDCFIGICGSWYENSRWDSKPLLCDGFSREDYNKWKNEDWMVRIAKTYGSETASRGFSDTSCGAWKCADNFVFNINTGTNENTAECISNSQCYTLGDGTTYQPKDGKCQQIKWCSDADAISDRRKFSASIHTMYNPPGKNCQNFKCKNPNYCLEEQTGYCQKIEPNTFGGRYINSQFVCASCDATKPVNSDGNACSGGNVSSPKIMEKCKEYLTADYKTATKTYLAAKNENGVIESFRQCNIDQCWKDKDCCAEKRKQDGIPGGPCPM